MSLFRFQKWYIRYAVDQDSCEESSDRPAPKCVEGDSFHTLFDQPVRLNVGWRRKYIRYMTLHLQDAAPAGFAPSSPLFERIEPVDHMTAMDHGWSRSHSMGFHVARDATVAVRDSRAGVTNVVCGAVGFRRGLHRWDIIWDPAQRGMHPVVGVGTRRTRIVSDSYEPLLCDAHAYGWHLKHQCLLHNLAGEPRDRLLLYPGKDFRDAEGGFHVPGVVSVLLNMEDGTLSFAVDDLSLGVAFVGLKGRCVYPMASTTWGQAKIQIRYMGGFYPEGKP